MSNLFGGGAKVASMTPTRAMGIQFMSSQYGPPVPVVYGTGKVGGTCIWYGDFASTSHSQKVGKGGGSRSTSYTYSASFMLGLCEGPVTGFGTVYDGTSTVDLNSVGAVTATGTAGQAPWSHLSGAFALGYSNTAWVAVQNMQLGSSASLPNWNVEVKGFHLHAGSSDANPADILTDICTDTTHGIDFNYLGDLTQYSNYCIAAGLLLSPVYDKEQTAQQTLEDLFKFTNSAAYFSEGVLKVVPYGDTSITGNGVTYSPNNSPLVNLGSADFLVSAGEDAVQITRKAPADAMNMVRVQYQDRSNSYHNSVVVASIDEDVVVNGARADTTEDVSMCKVASTARFIAQNLVQRSFFVRNTYEFKLGWRYCYLEPMDIVTLTDASTGLNQWPVRIIDITEDENGDLSITAEEYPEGVGHSAIYNTQPNNGGSIDPNTDPGAVNPPYIFRGPGFLVSNAGPEIWLAVNGSNALWGGAEVYLSHDGSSYSYVGTVAQPARYGSLTTALGTGSDPDTTNTPEVTVYAPSQLLGGSQADADNLVTLAMVDGEIISYETSTLVSSGTYQLGYLRRGAYGSAIASHASGAPFVRLDDAIFCIPIDPSLIGQTVYLKFLSINSFGRTPRTLAGETAYTYVVGTNVELPDVPPVPASFGTQGVADGVSITWSNSNPAAVGCTSIERSTSSSGPWTVIAQVGPTTTGYTDHFTNGATYYYRARARGPLVSSGWSAYTSTFNSSGTNVNAISTTANNASPATIYNPNFTQGMAGWTPESDASNWYAETGTNGPTTGTTQYLVHHDSGTTTFCRNSSRAPVAPGQVIKGGLLVRGVGSPTGTAVVRLLWQDVNGNDISSTVSNSLVGNGVETLTVSGVAPSNAAFCQINPGVGYATGNLGYYNFDNVWWNAQPSSVDEVPDGTNYGRTASNYLNANRPITDFADTFHRNKNLDNVGDGSNYGRPLLSRLNAGRPVIDFSESIHSNKTLDYMGDGSTYYRMPVANMDANRRALVDFSQGGHLGKNLDNIADTSNWARAAASRINAGRPLIDFSEAIHLNKKLDWLADTPSYAKSPAMGGSSIVVPNANFLAPVDAAGNIPGWVSANGATLAYYTTNASPFTNTQCLHITYSGSSPNGFGASSTPNFKVDAGDTLFVKGWAYAETGAAAQIIVYFFSSAGSYLGQITAQNTSYNTWVQVSASGVAPSGTSQAFIRVFNPNTDGGSSYFYGISVTRAHNIDTEVTDGTTYARIYGSDLSGGKHRIGIAGSGYQIGDQRNLKQRTITNTPAKVPTSISYSATAGSPAAATISVGAFTVLAGSVSVSYNAMSVSTSGSGGTTVTYYLYCDDANYAGGTQTLVATTNGNDCYASDARVYVGNISVTYPTSGSGSGSGGGGGTCVCAHMWLDEDTQARECVRGYLADCLDLPTSGLRKFRRRMLGMEMNLAPCVRITTAGGAVLECSTTTPFDLLDGRTARAPDMEGEQVVTDRGVERVVSVIDIGEQLVCHQHYGGCSYAAGADPSHRIYSHNMFEKP